MSTWKSARNVADEAAKKAVTDQARSPVSELKPPPKTGDAEVVRLEIDLDAEPGGDPYNCTGQHLLDAIRQFEE